jgi:MFS family permease
MSRLGYRRILLTNTVAIGLLIMLFATITTATPTWLLAVQMFGFGFLSSLQYTCMNSLVFADVSDADTSMGSSISSTAQQMSMSFGVAVASLTTAVFTGGVMHPDAPLLMTAIRQSFLVLGALTVVSTLVFRQLRPVDGANISQRSTA